MKGKLTIRECDVSFTMTVHNRKTGDLWRLGGKPAHRFLHILWQFLSNLQQYKMQSVNMQSADNKSKLNIQGHNYTVGLTKTKVCSPQISFSFSCRAIY